MYVRTFLIYIDYGGGIRWPCIRLRTDSLRTSSRYWSCQCLGHQREGSYNGTRPSGGGCKAGRAHNRNALRVGMARVFLPYVQRDAAQDGLYR